MTIWYILLVILGISVLVITHELGHYLMGKWLGFTITEFSVGLGPKLFGIKGKETEFTLRALPIGGSCRFFGEDGNNETDKKHPEAFEDGEPEDQPEEPKEPDPRLFSSKPAWKRFLVVLAGPLVNILTCTVLCFVMLVGADVLLEQSKDTYLIVDTVYANGAAEKAGMQPGDVILSIDGTELADADALDTAMQNASMEGMTVTVLRNAKITNEQTTEDRVTTTDVTVDGTVETLRFGSLLDQKTGNKRMNISYRMVPRRQVTEQYSVGKAAYMAFPETWRMGKLVYQSFGMLITGQASCRDMSGMVGVVDFVSDEMAQTETASDAWELFLWFMALIAVNLGIMNLLPLPALDGGRLVFIIIEMIRRKPVPPEKEGMVHLIGMIALLLLIAAVTISDIMRCFGG